MLDQVEAEARPDRSATVAVLLRRWMDVVDHELTTRETTEGYVRRTLVPALGEMPVRKIQHRVDLIDRLYTHLRRCNQLCDGRNGGEGHVCKPMSPGGVRRLHGILSASFNYGISWGWMERNPAEHAHPPKLTRRRARPPEAHQVARLLDTAMGTDIELGVYLWLAVATGARRGELGSLRWSRIDDEHAQVVIDTNYVVRAGQRQLKATKTDADRRLSLDTISVELLGKLRAARQEALRSVRLALSDEAFVFSPDPGGSRPWHPDHWTHSYRRVADLVGIEQPLKNLRHFNATQLLSAGVDLRTTAGRLGHSDGGATTLRVYADWLPATDRKAAEALALGVSSLQDVADAAPPRAGAIPLPRPTRPVADVLGPPQRATSYRVILDALADAIREKRLSTGDSLPTMPELAEHFGVSRPTAQRAVTTLAAAGQVEMRRGRWAVAAQG